jgi:RNA polymerase sigma-70 factor (ECF subfamily)
VQDSDEELMARVQQADQQAFTRLLERHAPGLHGFLQRMMRNRADAEELTQESFLRVWRHANRFEPDRVRFSTWLYRIGHNLCVDRLRRRREVPLEAAPEPLDRADAERDLDEARMAALVRRLIERLPERQRTALVLCHHQGMTNQQAAAVLDVTVDALESLLARARRTLREQLKPYLAAQSRKAAQMRGTSDD